MESTPPLIANQKPATRRTGWMIYAILATFCLCLSILANMALFAMLFGRDGSTTVDTRHGRFEETYLQGENHARHKIVVIYLNGVITSAHDGALSEEGMVGDIRSQLDQAVADRNVKAIILRINSPGGEVVASDAIYQAVADAREYKPVVASMEAVGASGAYYAAMGASYVMATDLTMTGSIGVIMQTYGFGGLMDKVGVKSHTFKSGRYKDLLNPAREPTDDEKEMVQTLIMEVYEKFVGIVAKERGLAVKELKNGMADGRILSGNQALKAGLIDGLGGLNEAVAKAKSLAKIEDAKVITYQPLFSLRQLFRIFGESEQPKIRVEVSPSALQLEAGKLYFLPTYLFQ